MTTTPAIRRGRKMAPPVEPTLVPNDAPEGEQIPTTPVIAPSGRLYHVALPDLWQVLGTVGGIPDSTTLTIIRHLKNEGSYQEKSDPYKFRYDAEYLRGMMALVAMCCVTPRFDLSLEYGDGESVLGRRQMGWGDIEAIYFGFFRPGRPITTAQSTADDVSGVAASVPTGDDVSE